MSRMLTERSGHALTTVTFDHRMETYCKGYSSRASVREHVAILQIMVLNVIVINFNKIFRYFIH